MQERRAPRQGKRGARERRERAAHGLLHRALLARHLLVCVDDARTDLLCQLRQDDLRTADTNYEISAEPPQVLAQGGDGCEEELRTVRAGPREGTKERRREVSGVEAEDRNGPAVSRQRARERFVVMETKVAAQPNERGFGHAAP